MENNFKRRKKNFDRFYSLYVTHFTYLKKQKKNISKCSNFTKKLYNKSKAK